MYCPGVKVKMCHGEVETHGGDLKLMADVVCPSHRGTPGDIGWDVIYNVHPRI